MPVLPVCEVAARLPATAAGNFHAAAAQAAARHGGSSQAAVVAAAAVLICQGSLLLAWYCSGKQGETRKSQVAHRS